jgi:gluconate 2-dehydrogenase gamma chain
MSRQGASRREFLVDAATGVGVVAGAGLVPEALAQNHEQHQLATEAGASAAGRGAFFNADQAATVAAFSERIMPSAPGKPGARDAGVLNYIDLALAGAYADLQDFYRRGLAALDLYCHKAYNEPFTRLSTAQQDDVLAALDSGKAAEFTFPAAQDFFNTVRTHTMEGMFADPIYGGNRNFAGWRLVGFPGAQAVFTPADLQSHQEFSREPIMGLQAQEKMPARRS